MAVKVQRVENGIYTTTWLGQVSIEEIFQALDSVIGSVRSHNEKRAVLILDLSECSRIPFDVTNLRRLTEMDARVMGFLVVKPSASAQILLRMLEKLSTRRFEITETLPEAVTNAYEILGDVTKVSREILLRRAGLS